VTTAPISSIAAPVDIFRLIVAKLSMFFVLPVTPLLDKTSDHLSENDRKAAKVRK